MPSTPLSPLTAYRSRGTARPEPLLATKLYIPQARANLVPRPRLTDQLNRGLQGKLILVTAPAGFGKTTLLSEWLAQSSWPTAWLSLDESDNDPARFLTYVTAALQTVQDGFEGAMQELLSLPEQPSDEAVLTILLNAVTGGIQQDFALVLDDYHVVETDRIDSGLTFLLDHLPPQMHLVISSRTEPALPLARLRARGQLTELRVTDLRFTLDEVAIFLNEIMGFPLSAEDVAALEARTEGWVASLQLAAISMQGRKDIHEFVTAFTGDNRYVLDYLAEEVLNTQPEDVQRFLLQTSILDRLSAPLCSAVTGGNNAQEMLDTLDGANLIIPLDDRQGWYRYHYLFLQFLRENLQRSIPEAVTELHRRAAQWHEQHNLLVEAVNHYLAVEDFDAAAQLVERVGRTMLMRAEITTLLTWMKTLPDSLIGTSPQLCLIHAWALSIGNQSDAAEVRLKDAERALGISRDSSSTVLRRSTFTQGRENLDELFGEVVAIRTILALRKGGDIPHIIRLSQQALNRLPESSLFLRGVINLNLAGAYWHSGDIVQATEHYTTAARLSEAGNSLYIALIALANLAELKQAQGQLNEAYRTYEHFLKVATRPGGDTVSLAGLADIGMGWILFEWNQLGDAEEHLIEGIRLIEHDESADRILCGYGHLMLALFRLALDDIDGALTALDVAEKKAYLFNVRQRQLDVAEIRARIWIKQGNFAAVERWEQDILAEIDQHHSEHRIEVSLVLSQLYLSLGNYDRALLLIQPILTSAMQAGEQTTLLRALILKTMIYHAQGDIDAALQTLEQALTIGEQGSYIRTFVNEGPVIKALIQHMAATNTAPGYVTRLLSAFAEIPGNGLMHLANQPLVEPLSEREFEVLHGIAEGLSNREIADRLYVAVSTVKTHINNIYGKLQVNSRTQALARARDLGLLD